MRTFFPSGLSGVHARRIRHARGFSLLEVLVALLVISFGLLGVAGMQALSINNTSVAGYRSIAAMEAASLASAMSANEKYWTKGSVAPTVTVVGSTLGGGTLTTTGSNCATSTCGSTTMAEYDLQQWGTALANVLPNGTGTVNCNYTVGYPVTCQIIVNWTEKSLAQNQVSGVSATAGNTYDFEMVTQP
ncbi:MAG: type IV pilus modification protein PilV [Burkholderiaceae bacterium]|nr:type IV pilus modification protein PilV [Burkholderiaceae bacterium]